MGCDPKQEGKIGIGGCFSGPSKIPSAVGESLQRILKSQFQAQGSLAALPDPVVDRIADIISKRESIDTVLRLAQGAATKRAVGKTWTDCGNCCRWADATADSEGTHVVRTKLNK